MGILSIRISTWLFNGLAGEGMPPSSTWEKALLGARETPRCRGEPFQMLRIGPVVRNGYFDSVCHLRNSYVEKLLLVIG